MKPLAHCMLTASILLMLSLPAFAGGGDKTINFIVNNHSGTAIEANGGYCNYTQTMGIHKSTRLSFEGEIPPLQSKFASKEFEKLLSIDICTLYAYPIDGDRNYGLYFETTDKDKISFTLTNEHIQQYRNGQNVTIDGE